MKAVTYALAAMKISPKNATTKPRKMEKPNSHSINGNKFARLSLKHGLEIGKTILETQARSLTRKLASRLLFIMVLVENLIHLRK